MMFKNKNAKNVFDVLLISILLLVIARFILRRSGNDEEATLVNWFIAGVVLAAIILRIIDRFFPHWFKNKPGREELE